MVAAWSRRKALNRVAIWSLRERPARRRPPTSGPTPASARAGAGAAGGRGARPRHRPHLHRARKEPACRLRHRWRLRRCGGGSAGAVAGHAARRAGCADGRRDRPRRRCAHVPRWAGAGCTRHRRGAVTLAAVSRFADGAGQSRRGGFHACHLQGVADGLQRPPARAAGSGLRQRRQSRLLSGPVPQRPRGAGHEHGAGHRRLPPRVAGGGQGARRQSGSGATCYGLFDDASQAQRAAGAIAAANPGWWVRATVARPTHDRSAA